ncbi:hypothetical protein [Listeria seeligeri]|uniref:hypothetical protein n=1 Tax=Listeria seeligeri TaxID=1640 RepID=UPI001E33C0CD|nr:hypothetical protein [Listeria seeligeri]
MDYTQEESYYLLDAREDAVVYLGLKDGVRESDLIGALEEAQTGAVKLDATRCVNTFPEKTRPFLNTIGDCSLFWR